MLSGDGALTAEGFTATFGANLGVALTFGLAAGLAFATLGLDGLFGFAILAFVSFLASGMDTFSFVSSESMIMARSDKSILLSFFRKER